MEKSASPDNQNKLVTFEQMGLGQEGIVEKGLGQWCFIDNRGEENPTIKGIERDYVSCEGRRVRKVELDDIRFNPPIKTSVLNVLVNATGKSTTQYYLPEGRAIIELLNN